MQIYDAVKVKYLQFLNVSRDKIFNYAIDKIAEIFQRGCLL